MYDVYLSYSSRDERAGGGLLALHKEKWARITMNKFVCALSSLKYIGTYRYVFILHNMHKCFLTVLNCCFKVRFDFFIFKY